MLRLAFILLLVSFGQLTFGQSKAIGRDKLLFEKGLLLQQMIDQDLSLDQTIKDSIRVKSDYATGSKESILKKALEFYDALIDSFPKSKLLYRALNNKAFIAYSLDDTATAKKTFLAMIHSQANVIENSSVGPGLMMEPYANYKNKAVKVLALISIQAQNWNEALTYLDLTKEYPYRHFCGNEYAAEAIYMAELYAQCYLGLHDYKKAYSIFLPNILENGLADNSDLVDTAYTALLKTYNRADLKKQFELAFKNIRTETIKYGTKEYERPYVIFLDTKIEINGWRFDFADAQNKDKEIAAFYEGSRFYKLLSD